MSPTVNNFVHDLVAMAKAMEDLPAVQAELGKAQSKIEDLAETVQDRELAILEYKATIDSLLKDKQALEVARDDAELRFLELEEKAHTALAMGRSITAALGNLTGTLEPVVSAPTPIISEVKPIAGDPTPVVDTPTAHADTAQSSDTAIHNDASQPPQGQSEADPTIPQREGTASTAFAQDAVGTTDHTPTDTPKPYAGKRYSEAGPSGTYPSFIAFVDWIDGGGTTENYHN